MRSKTTVLVTALAATTVGLGVVGGASGGPTASQAACGTFVGPAWTFTNPLANPPEQKGTKWKLTAKGVKCSFASMWAKQLVKTPFRGEALTKFKKVPAGWTCIAGGGLTGGGKGTPGQCNQGRKMFHWAPAVP